MSYPQASNCPATGRLRGVEPPGRRRSELSVLAADGVRPFDVHAHTGADIDGTTRTSAEHLAELEAIDARSVIFPLCVRIGYEAENRRVLEECSRAPERLTPFARLDPRAENVGFAAVDALTAGAKGFKLHPRSEDFRLDHPGVDAIFPSPPRRGRRS